MGRLHNDGDGLTNRYTTLQHFNYKIMKYISKLFLIFSFLLLFANSYSQDFNKDKKYIKELKLLIQDLSKKKQAWLFIYLNDTLTLPAYFTSYKKFITNEKKINSYDDWVFFKPKNAINFYLKESDFEEIKNGILNDTNRFYINNTWFENFKINILSDSTTKSKKYTDDFMTPIFFRNYTRCFIAILGTGYMDSFFLKKINNHWVFDNFYQRYIND